MRNRLILWIIKEYIGFSSYPEVLSRFFRFLSAGSEFCCRCLQYSRWDWWEFSWRLRFLLFPVSSVIFRFVQPLFCCVNAVQFAVFIKNAFYKVNLRFVNFKGEIAFWLYPPNNPTLKTNPPLLTVHCSILCRQHKKPPMVKNQAKNWLRNSSGVSFVFNWIRWWL